MKRNVKRHAVVQPLDPSYRLIPLTQGRNAIVDASDYDSLSQWNWCAHLDSKTENFYAERKLGKKMVKMHREILQCKSDHIDHKNQNTLDNRRANLRPATNSQNLANRGKQKNNTSGFKSVRWRKECGKWQARCAVNGRTINLGLHSTPEKAHAAYAKFVKETLGEFANAG